MKEKKENKKPKSFNYLACNNCHTTDSTLIKATDSYYCSYCFKILNKQKYKK